MKRCRVVWGFIAVCVALVALPRATAEARRNPYVEVPTATTNLLHVKGLAHRFNTDYIGITIDSNRNGEFDIDDISLMAIPVRGPIDEVVPIHHYKLNYNLAGTGYIVSLWGDRVENCGCDWCDKYGYHLVDRLATVTGRIQRSSLDW